jgi:hypothetical protein
MKPWVTVLALFFGVLAADARSAQAQQSSPQRIAPSLPQEDSSYVDGEGTAYVYRIVPMPHTISPEAQKYLTKPVPHPGPGASVAENRASTDAMQAHDSALNRALYPVNIEKSTVAGVPVLIVTPVDPIPGDKADRVQARLPSRSPLRIWREPKLSRFFIALRQSTRSPPLSKIPLPSIRYCFTRISRSTSLSMAHPLVAFLRRKLQPKSSSSAFHCRAPWVYLPAQAISARWGTRRRYTPSLGSQPTQLRGATAGNGSQPMSVPRIQKTLFFLRCIRTCMECRRHSFSPAPEI